MKILKDNKERTTDKNFEPINGNGSLSNMAITIHKYSRVPLNIKIKTYMNNEHFKSQSSLIPPWCPIHLMMNIIVDKRQMTIFDIKHLHAAEAPDDYFQFWLLCQNI